jgi:nitronate monooxygenase
VRQWRGREEELRAVRDGEAQRYKAAAASGDASIVATIVGEVIGLITSIEPAASIVEAMASQAEERLKAAFNRLG